jgi:hypothetical protein
MKRMKRTDWILTAIAIAFTGYPLFLMLRYTLASEPSWCLIVGFAFALLWAALTLDVLLRRAYGHGEEDAMRFDRIIFGVKDREIYRLRKLLDEKKQSHHSDSLQQSDAQISE